MAHQRASPSPSKSLRSMTQAPTPPAIVSRNVDVAITRAACRAVSRRVSRERRSLDRSTSRQYHRHAGRKPQAGYVRTMPVLGVPVTLAAAGFISLLRGADSGDRRRYWLARRAAAGLAGLTAGGERVDGNRDREDERGVLACHNVDAVGLAHAKPLLGDRRHSVAVALDLVLVVADAPVRLHIGAVLDVDREAISDPHQRLVDGRGGVALALDRDLVADAELALLDPGNLVPRRVLEDKGLSDAKRLAVDLEGPFTQPVLNPVVVADRQQLLAHLKPLAIGLVAAPQ